MKKIIIALFIICSFVSISNALETEYGGIGTWMYKDGSKTVILKVYPDTPASKSLLQEGSELIAVDGVKVKGLQLEQISEKIRGSIGTSVTLLVKEDGKKKEYTINRAKVNINKPNDERYMLHWKQVDTEGYSAFGHINNSRRYSSQLQNKINVNNYWASREDVFKNGYNACLSYPKNEQNACLMNLVNREIAKTDKDRQIEIQEQMARQQATQNFVNTMNQIQTNTNLNNINNSLQQQNFQLQNTNMQLHNINNTLRGW